MDTSNKNIVQGVNCTVDNCAYNHCDSKTCTAGKINVGPTSAKTKDETICATFKNKTSY